jgi:thymidine kinase
MNTKTMQAGHLELIVGPMYASKSTEVIRRINRYRSKKLKVLVINHSFNNRYDSCHITTHDSLELEACLILPELSDIWKLHMKYYQEADIIVIEELQFFPDALDFITTSIDRDKKQIIAAGLIADYQRKPFGQVLDLMPYADEITHLKAYCSICPQITDGVFTKRITNDSSDQILVGTKESYITVCRYHYLEN